MIAWALGLLLTLVGAWNPADAYVATPPSRRGHSFRGGIRPLTSSASEPPAQPSSAASDLKRSLLDALSTLQTLQERDGTVSVDFGVRGGELNSETRAPQKVDYYSISADVGDAASRVIGLCDELAKFSPIDEPTAHLGDKERGGDCPLDGPWRLLFTTAADASFSKNSTRGSARVQNVVDGKRGRITNVIDFDPKEDGTEPSLKQLNVVIKATAEHSKRVALQFRYAKVVLTKFFGIPLFGRKLSLYIPVPAAFITRLVVLIGRLFRFGRKAAKRKVPKAYFDVLYLDNMLRVHKTGDDNIFIQGKEEWEEAKTLFQ